MKRSDLSRLPAHARAEVERQLGEKPAPKPYAPGMPAKMNKGETAYAFHLKALADADEIFAFGYEAVRLELANRTTLLPDFFVRLKDGTIEFHEVKGRKGETFYCKEDAWLKLKVAARAYHFWTFYVVWPAPGSAGWRKQRVLP